MHGHKRAEYKHRLRDPQLAAALGQKAQQWYALGEKSLQLRAADTNGELDLPLLDKMLRVNPDPLHLWNHRRVVLSKHQSKDWLPGEMALTAAALERNPKAYGAWFHRKWALQQQQQQTTTTTSSTSDLLSTELALTEQFLQRDERNFHCWNFRRFLVGLEMGKRGDGSWNLGEEEEEELVIGPQITCDSVSDANKKKVDPALIHKILQREWEFTQTKIVQNFSNFSAFHYRSKLVGLVGDDWTPVEKVEGKSTTQTIAQSEWSLMENIIFTEPDDQTIWWYHRFVVDWAKTNKEEEWYAAWLQAQAEALQMLVEDEPECKWGLLGYHLVLSRMEPSEETNTQKMESLLDQLMQIDPDRAQRYETLRKK